MAKVCFEKTPEERDPSKSRRTDALDTIGRALDRIASSLERPDPAGGTLEHEIRDVLRVHRANYNRPQVAVEETVLVRWEMLAGNMWGHVQVENERLKSGLYKGDAANHWHDLYQEEKQRTTAALEDAENERTLKTALRDAQMETIRERDILSEDVQILKDALTSAGKNRRSLRKKIKKRDADIVTLEKKLATYDKVPVEFEPEEGDADWVEDDG